MNLSCSMSLSIFTALPQTPHGSQRFPYVSRHSLVDVDCQAGVSSPAWSLAGQDGRLASQPRHTVGGQINPHVPAHVSQGRTAVVALALLHTLAVYAPPPCLQDRHIPPRGRVELFILPVKREEATKGRENIKVNQQDNASYLNVGFWLGSGFPVRSKLKPIQFFLHRAVGEKKKHYVCNI